jgi:hypothetical protein
MMANFPEGKDMAARLADTNHDDRVVEKWQTLPHKEKTLVRLCCSDMTNK